MNDTCDECKFFNLANGYCKKDGKHHRACGETTCKEFELADDLKDGGLFGDSRK